MSKKRDPNKADSVPWLISSAAHNRLKNVSAAVNATRRATTMFLIGVNQKLLFLFFCTKIV